MGQAIPLLVPAKLVAKLRPSGKFLAYDLLAEGLSNDKKAYKDLSKTKLDSESMERSSQDIPEVVVDYDFYEFLPRDYGF